MQSLQQSYLLPRQDLTIYGDHPSRKTPKSFRHVFGNVDGMGAHSDTQKDQLIWDSVRSLKADSVGLVEINLNHSVLPPAQRLHARARHCLKESFNLALAHNSTHASKSPHQWGGCASMMLSQLSPRVLDTHRDPIGLGRWVSHLVGGKGNTVTRLVTAYLPCRSKGHHTVYSQHRHYYNTKNQDKEPITQFLLDLKEVLSEWISAGELIILGMDANQDVRTGDAALMLQSLGLQEQITRSHSSHCPPPATHVSNSRAIPIDGIWTNFAHGQMRCGYTGFHEGITGDHRTLWIDIPKELFLGHNPPNLHRVYPPVLTTRDPRIRKKYNHLMIQKLQAKGTFHQVRQLRKWVADNVKAPESPPHSIDHINELHQSINDARKQASLESAAKCRKKHTGAFPYSPQVKKLLEETILWSKVISFRSNKRHMGSKQIRHLMKKLNIPDAFQVTLKEAGMSEMASSTPTEAS